MRLDELSQQIAAYGLGRVSLDAFEDWFRSHSRGMFGESPEVLNACIGVEEAFSELRAFGDVSRFRMELANAVRPFAAQRPVVLSRSPYEQIAATSAVVMCKPVVLAENVVFYTKGHQSAKEKPAKLGGSLPKTASPTARMLPVYAQQA
jgi:hypothetical protein